MSNKIFIILLITLLPFLSPAQEKKTISIDLMYGMAGNFFVDYGRSYQKEDGFHQPYQTLGGLFFSQKNFLGTISGIEFNGRIKNKNILGYSFEREVHTGKYSGNYNIGESGAIFYARFIKLRHANDFHTLYYKRAVGEKSKIWIGIGFYLLNSHQQEIEILAETIKVQERDAKNYNLQEIGAMLSAEYFFLNKNFLEVGLKLKAYYTISTVEMETISISPTLRFNISTKKKIKP